MLRHLFRILFLAACLLPVNRALAVTQSMTAHIAFATPASVGITDEGAVIVTGAENQIRNVSVDGDEDATTISVIYQ